MKKKKTINQNLLSFSDRVSRLVLITAILGGLGVFYVKLLKVIFNGFTKTVYLKSFYNIEHVLAAAMLTTGGIVLIFAIWYCYCELIALNHSNKFDKLSIRIIQKADNTYGSLLEIIKIYICLSLITLFLFLTIIGFITNNYVLIGFFSTILIIIMLTIFLKRSKSIVNKNMKKLLIFVKSKATIFFVWIVGFIFIFTSIIVVMGSHLSVKFKIDFINNNNIPISFHFKNSIPDEVQIKYYTEEDIIKSEVSHVVNLKKSDYRISFLETTRNDRITNSILQSIDDVINKKQESVLLDETKYDYKYDLISRPYLKEGQNIIVIEFNTKSAIGTKYYRIVNQINITKSGFEITNETFE